MVPEATETVQETVVPDPAPEPPAPDPVPEPPAPDPAPEPPAPDPVPEPPAPDPIPEEPAPDPIPQEPVPDPVTEEPAPQPDPEPADGEDTTGNEPDPVSTEPTQDVGDTIQQPSTPETDGSPAPAQTDATEVPSSEIPNAASTPTSESEGGDDEDSDKPDASPTAIATPTQTPTPVVTWSQPAPVECVLQAESSAELEHEESASYDCLAQAQVSSDIDMPDDMQIEWDVEVNFPETHTLQLPSGSDASIIEQQPGSTETSQKYTLARPWHPEASTQDLAFEIEVTRATCSVGDQVATVQAVPEISTHESEAEIVHEGVAPEVETATLEFLPNPTSPTVNMTPVDFGTFQWDGVSWGTSNATSKISIHSDGCETSVPHEVHVEIAASNPGMTPVISQVIADGTTVQPAVNADGVSNTGLVATIPAGFTGEAEFEVEFALSPAHDAAYGEHHFGFTVSIKESP